MALSNNTPIEIRQVSNGYVVMPSSSEDRARMASDDDRIVFQTFAELQAWLARHFTHREKQVAVDGA